MYSKITLREQTNHWNTHRDREILTSLRDSVSCFLEFQLKYSQAMAQHPQTLHRHMQHVQYTHHACVHTAHTSCCVHTAHTSCMCTYSTHTSCMCTYSTHIMYVYIRNWSTHQDCEPSEHLKCHSERKTHFVIVQTATCVYTYTDCNMCVYIYILQHVCIHIQTATCVYTYTDCNMCVYTYRLQHVCIHIQTATCVYTHTDCNMCVYTYRLQHVCIHIQ